MSSDQVELSVHGTAAYRRALRAAANGLWSGAIDFVQFYDTVEIAMTRHLTLSWYEGAKECGITPAELTPEERQALQTAIIGEAGHIFTFGDFVEQNSKANGGKRGVVYERVEMWVLRARDVKNQARVMACADQKLEWVRGPTLEGCTTCDIKLSGKVKRASYWARIGVRPQNPPNPLLECGGWGCLCQLLPTDKPLSKGPLPKLP